MQLSGKEERGALPSSLSLPIPTEAAPDVVAATLADVGYSASGGLWEHLPTLIPFSCSFLSAMKPLVLPARHRNIPSAQSQGVQCSAGAVPVVLSALL